MYFPFHTEQASDLPPAESWYQNHAATEQADNSASSSEAAETEEDNGEPDVSLQIALTIMNELADLSAWLQSQTSAMDASAHVTFDAEGRPVVTRRSPSAMRRSGRLQPARPVLPPSYSRAIRNSANLPSLEANPYQSSEFDRFVSRYSGEFSHQQSNEGPGLSHSSPPPSYSRATSQSPRADLVDRTPPPSYGRAVRDNRERPHLNAIVEAVPFTDDNFVENY